MFHQTNTLTTGIDAVTGTAGDDTISGARVDTIQTWNSGDKIDGGAGNDTLTAVITASVDPATGGVKNVENIVVTALGTSTVTFANASGSTVKIAGVENITNVASTHVLTLANLTTIPEITLSNASAGTVVTFATDVLAGTADTVTLNLSGVNPAADAVGGGINLAAGAAGIENLVINSTAAASSINAPHFDVTNTDDLGLGGANSSVKTLTVTGDADLTLAGSAFAKVTSFDGSTATGGITASFATFGSGKTNVQTITTGAGKDTITLGQDDAEYTSITVNTGAGDDKVVVGTTLSSKHSIDGGAGKDTLSINTGGATITVDNIVLVNNQTSNFEVMEFANRVDVLNASSFTGFTDYVFTTASAASSPAQTVITGLSSGNTLTFRGDLLGVAGSTNVTDGESALSLAASGTKQTAKLTLNSNESGAVSGLNNLAVDIIGGVGGDGAAAANGKVAQSAITFGAGIDTLQIAATTAVNIIGGAGGDGHVTDTGVGGAAAAAIDNSTAVKTVIITGNGAVTIKGGAAGDEGATGTGGVKAAGGDESLNGFTGAVTVNASALKGILTIQGSSGNDTIIGGAGADIITGGAGADTLTGGAGADTFNFDIGEAAIIGLLNSNTITDFVAGTDKLQFGDDAGDVFDGITATSVTLGAAATITTSVSQLSDIIAAIGIGTAATVGTALSAKVYTFTTGSAAGTYLHINDDDSAVADAADIFVNLTGISGTLTATDFTFV